MFRRISLCKKCKNKTAQHVTATGGGHARISRGVEKNMTVRLHNSSICPFYKTDTTVAGGKNACALQPLRGIPSVSDQPLQLAGMRREDGTGRQKLQPCRIFGKKVQGIGVTHDGTAIELQQLCYYRESLLSITKKGQSGAEEIRHMMEEYREHPYSSIHGIEVVRIDDILLSTSTDCRTGAKTPIQQPKSDVLQFHLADGSKVTMRPSGTEPKIKFYFSVREKLERREDYDAAVEAAEAKIQGIIQYMKLK